MGAVDRRLAQLRRKQELLQTYKRGVMHKIFSLEIRFKGAIGSEFPDWEEKDLMNWVNSKMVLTQINHHLEMEWNL